MSDRILVVDDEDTLRESLTTFLRREGYQVHATVTGREALKLISQDSVSIVVSDIRLPDIDGLTLLKQISQMNPETSVILITAYASVETAVQALRQGAVDYVVKPIRFEEMLSKIRNLLRYKQVILENQILRRELEDRYHYRNIVGESQAMKEVFQAVERVKETKSTVLITGESGTGKELIARAIHYAGERKKEHFVPINCSAIPENLLESELFGHTKGAFTGATQDKEGLFYTAHRGTLFLDEVSELPLKLQAKLLRAIETKEILPVGGRIPSTMDVRVVAATNTDLATRVRNGQFREDLYYRLNVVEINIPSLRERRDDIPALVRHFINRFNAELKKSVKGVTNETMRIFLNHPWKGNVRELENTIERAMIYCDGDFIEATDLPANLLDLAPQPDVTDNLKEAMQLYEIEHIQRVLIMTGGNKRVAAQRLGIGLSSLYRKLNETDPFPSS